MGEKPAGRIKARRRLELSEDVDHAGAIFRPDGFSREGPSLAVCGHALHRQSQSFKTPESSI